MTDTTAAAAAATATTTTDGSSRSKNLESMIYSNVNGTTPKLSVLDQLLIPQEKKYIDIPNVESAWSVIRTMQIRGAPLIAIVALLGLAVDLYTNPKTLQTFKELEEKEEETKKTKNAEDNDDDNITKNPIVTYIQGKMEYLKTSRPTAVNLFNALDELQQAMMGAIMNNDTTTSSPLLVSDLLRKEVLQYAEFMLQRDVSDNRAIGSFGATAIVAQKQTTTTTNGTNDNNKIHMVTICNTGSLATAGYGTALGVARALQEQNQLASITALETRPYNQGSRLTAYEIMEENMPGGRLICDSAAGALMQTQSIDAVVVGADRVCANGDTANKIGTYNLSIIAKYHKVPFYVAAPITSCDVTLPTGTSIPIEERSNDELISTSKAPLTMNCWNPAFDVTPACNITGGIITEMGIITPDPENGTIDVKTFVEKHAAATSSKRKRND